jgi:hypothetical protein
MKTNWIEKWEYEKELREDLLLYQNELDNAINEAYTLKQQLKVYEYRIEKLNEIIKQLNEKL